MCLDNVDDADDPEVSGILDALSQLANPLEQNGWIVVTPRHGSSNLWSGLKKEQRIFFAPFSEEDAMCLLWRIAKETTIEDADDPSVARTIESWKVENKEEHCALWTLSGNQYFRGLGGLGIALVQALSKRMVLRNLCRKVRNLPQFGVSNARSWRRGKLVSSDYLSYRSRSFVFYHLFNFNDECLCFIGRAYDSAYVFEKRLELMQARNTDGQWNQEIVDTSMNTEALSTLQMALSFLKSFRDGNPANLSFATIHVTLGLILLQQGSCKEAKESW